MGLERVAELIKEGGYRRVLIQLPEGLKERAAEISERLTGETGCTVIISGDPCYGACDLADSEAEALGCSALFHFGHSQILKNTAVPVHYVEVKSGWDPLPLLARNIELLPRRLGLVTTVQHVHLLGAVASFLKDAGFDVRIGRAGGRAAYEGQVLGCSFASARDVADEVDAFLYIGTGDFHPLGVALSTGKKVLALDLEKGELRDMDGLKDAMLRRRFAQIAKAKEAKSFGIVVGEKQGQRRLGLATRLLKTLEEHGRRGYLISLREITPDALLPFRHMDAFVNTACPRVTVDDAERYPKPLLTPVELEIVLGTGEWEDYEMDEIG
ncbi:MAG: diphthamide biosynthesis enzyme Dph2 [Methanobacteriota archaeon]|nr:MAG: diphthamide biosynthesis enzyme Dph2 [Euryarchaeota archaeon]